MPGEILGVSNGAVTRKPMRGTFQNRLLRVRSPAARDRCRSTEPLMMNSRRFTRAPDLR